MQCPQYHDVIMHSLQALRLINSCCVIAFELVTTLLHWDPVHYRTSAAYVVDKHWIFSR